VVFSARLALLGLAASGALLGCTPSIGDKCVLSTDCSLAGDRLCDTSQPGGYCTIFGCTPNSCPDYAACIMFHSGVQGCPYDDRTYSRTGRSFCVAGCKSNSDCRYPYICKDVRQAPWSATILDDNQAQMVCVVNPDQALDNVPNASYPDAAVCQANPDIDAALPVDASSATAPDAGDAGADANDAGHD
jgi:hypothetical protein